MQRSKTLCLSAVSTFSACVLYADRPRAQFNFFLNVVVACGYVVDYNIDLLEVK